MKTGVKHLIECNCVLQQYANVVPPVFHKFVVFSVVDDNGDVAVKHVQCPNCNVVHRVDNLTRSTILSKETLASMTSLEDVKQSLDVSVVNVLERHDVDLATWENVAFVIEQQQWGSCVTLASDKLDDDVQRKVLHVLGPKLFKVEQVSVNDVIG